MQHVLVISGEPEIWQVTRAILGQDGYRVSRVASLDAVNRLQQDRPDLAIVDSALRRMSAVEIATEARRRAIPVLLTTDERVPEAQLAHFGFACLRKPFAERELLARSRQLIAAARENHNLLRASLKQMRARAENLQDAISQVQQTVGRVVGAAAAHSGARYDFRADPILREALDRWRRKRGERAMPCRRDIDAAELPFWLLPHLQLTDVIEGGRRFRYRLVGTAIVGAFGAEFTGKHVDELPPSNGMEGAHAFYDTVCDAKQPVFARSSYSATKGVSRIVNRLLLPLSEDGREVSAIAGAVTFEFARPLPLGADRPANYLEIVS